MVVNCEYVWQEVSNYLEGEVTPELRIAIETHVRGCLRCTAVVTSTRSSPSLSAMTCRVSARGIAPLRVIPISVA